MSNETAVDSVKEKAQETAQVATDQGRNVAQQAQEQVAEVAGTVKEQLSTVTAEISQQGTQLLDEASQQIREQAEAQTHRLASTLRSYSEECRALSDGRPEDAPTLRPRIEQAGEQMSDLADRLEHRGYQGALDDLQNFARRRPGLFLLGAATAGFAVGRLIKTSRRADADREAERAEPIYTTELSAPAPIAAPLPGGPPPEPVGSPPDIVDVRGDLPSGSYNQDG